MAYIYKIWNDINNKIYIGKTEFSLQKRWKEHCRDYKKENINKRPLYSAMKKYGIEHFHISLIEKTDHPEERECFWISFYNSYKNGYNATFGGDGKRYIDYNLILKLYEKEQNCNTVAKLMNISKDTVINVLHNYNINVRPGPETSKRQLGKPVIMKKNNQPIYCFSDQSDAARWLIEQKKTNDKKVSSISYHIGQVVRGKRKTAYGYQWQSL